MHIISGDVLPRKHHHLFSFVPLGYHISISLLHQNLQLKHPPCIIHYLIQKKTDRSQAKQGGPPLLVQRMHLGGKLRRLRPRGLGRAPTDQSSQFCRVSAHLRSLPLLHPLEQNHIIGGTFLGYNKHTRIEKERVFKSNNHRTSVDTTTLQYDPAGVFTLESAILLWFLVRLN